MALAAVALVRAFTDETGGSPPSAGIKVELKEEGSVAETVTPVPLPEVQNPRLSADSFHAGAAIVLSAFHRDQDLIRWYAYLAERGVNALSLNFPFFTEGATSNTVFIGNQTPSDEELRFAIAQAHEMGFTIFLRPLLNEHILFQGNPEDWRGTLRPVSIPTWFENYTSLILHYARLAEEEKVELFSVGVELVSLAGQTEEWRDLIAKVREVYSGQVAYSANWDEVDKVTFWGDVDVIAIDAFFDLDVSDTPTVEEMVDAWRNKPTYVGVPLEIMQNVYDTWGKPVILAEFGVAPEVGAEKHPWAGGGTEPPTEQDLMAQANYYRAGFTATDKPFIQGYYVWFVIPDQDPAQAKLDPDYSPWGKPAEEIIAEFYQRKTS